MLKNTSPYSNNRHVSHIRQLPHILKINLHTRLDDGKDPKSKIDDKTKNELKEEIKNELEKDLKCEIGDKTKNELKEEIKNELKKDLKCEIGDKTKNEIKDKIKNELEKDLKFEIDDKTKNEIKDKIKNELEKDLKFEIGDKTKDELKEKIKNELEKDLNCKIDDKTKDELKEKIKNELEKDLNCKIDDKAKDELIKEVEEKIDKELRVKLNCDILKTCNLEEKTRKIFDEGECDRKGCDNSRKDGNYIEVTQNGKLYIREALNKIYPDLSADIIDKIKTDDYYVKQLGIAATNCDKNGMEYPFITWRGSMNANCMTIPPNSLCKESYNVRQIGDRNDWPDWYASCKNHVFSDDAYLTNTRAYYYPDSIDKNKPVVVLSQSESLIVADKKTDRLIKKDGTISNKTFDECKEFFDQ
ncbi:midas domain-containing protein [Wolbachia endosymbiont (group B) of Euphydryas aurinia]|nr:hypothetical protein [Wolbachia endosymbiont (group B) of Euphydryas aurinia]